MTTSWKMRFDAGGRLILVLRKGATEIALAIDPTEQCGAYVDDMTVAINGDIESYVDLPEVAEIEDALS